jgi:hypothetical protein
MRALLLFFLTAATVVMARPLAHMAENNVQVAMIEVSRASQHTEVRLETRAALKGVCWSFEGSNSPYLISEGRRYRFIGGEHISNCPQKQDYASYEIMILRFQPLPANVREFSLVEGEGGENQMIEPTARRNQTFWNFLRVRLD